MYQLRLYSPIFICLLSVCNVQSFSVLSSTSNRITTRSTETALKAIEVPSLDVLDGNNEKEASRLAKSIIGWLDQEWIPQEVHVQMAECAESSFLTARNNGETEIMNIMTIVVDDLVENWQKYDKDAFVNAWDIGNYVSDYLHYRIDPVDSCGCSANIFQPDEE